MIDGDANAKPNRCPGDVKPNCRADGIANALAGRATLIKILLTP